MTKALYKIEIKGNALVSKTISSGKPEFLHENIVKYDIIKKLRKFLAKIL